MSLTKVSYSMITGAPVNPIDHGADPTGVDDSAAAFTDAIAKCIATNGSLVGEGAFKFLSPVDFRKTCVNMPNATFDIAHAGLGIYLGGNSANPNNPPQHIGSVTRSVGVDSYSTPSIRVVGASVQHIAVEFVDYIQLYADTDSSQSGQSYAIQYSTFTVKNCVTLELTNNAASDGSYQQYINENTFYFNAIQNLLINSATIGGSKYGHNHNTFNGGSFELGTIDMEVGATNYVNNIRGEQGLTVTFESGVQDCMVTIGWVSSGHRYPANDVIIQNRGSMCAVQHLYDLYAPITPMVGFDYQRLKKVATDYNVIGVSNVVIGADLTVAAFDYFYNSGLIPVDGENTVFELNLYKKSGVGGGIRTYVTGYDSAGVAITPAPNQVTYNGLGNKQFGESSNTSNTWTAERFYVLDPECKYITIEVRASGTGASFDSFFLGSRIADVGLRKKLAAATVTNNNFV